MNTDLTSVVFLAILVLVPLGIITGIVLLIVKKIRGRTGLRSISERLGWAYSGQSPEAVAEVRALLEPTLFAIRKGRHNVGSIASGSTNSTKCWITEYHYRSVGSNPETRRGGTYSLLIMERTDSGSNLILQHRQKGALAAVAERMAAGQLSPATADGWSWALTSSNDDLNSLPRAAGTGAQLEEKTMPGDMIFCYPGIVVWSRPLGISRKWAEEVPEMITILSRL